MLSVANELHPTEKSHAENQGVPPPAWRSTAPLNLGLCCISVTKKFHPNGKAVMPPQYQQ